MSSVVNPKMVLLAREARGLSQSALTARLNTHKSTVSRLEHGLAPGDESLVLSLSAATGYPPQFFVQEGGSLPVNLSYRKRKKVAAGIITPIEAQVNIIRRHLQLIEGAADQYQLQLPPFKADVLTAGDAGTEENAAQMSAARLRQQWNLPAGSIYNLCRAAEQQGILVCNFDFGTDRVDSRSILTGNNRPIIFLNRRLLGDRQRFSLAFELGHLAMHTFSPVPHDQDITHEANCFAADFLMPENDIRQDFEPGITLPLLGELKRKWKVSMVALLYRADDIGLLTPNQKRYLLQQFNDQKIRRREPPQLDVPPEQPQLVRQLFNGFMQQAGLSRSQLCTLLAINEDEFVNYYFSEKAAGF